MTDYEFRIIRKVEPFGPLDYVESVGPGGLLDESDYRKALDELRLRFPSGKFELQRQEVRPWIAVKGS